MFSKLIIPVTLLLLAAAWVLRTEHADASVADGYHDAVAKVVSRIPLDFDGWSGKEVALPPAAISLLRPNAIMARDYYHADREIHATLMVVQCRDIRDMAGHYPPVCYPAHGWSMVSAGSPVEVDGELMKPYLFTRVMGDVTHEITVYNLFALPTGSTTVSMEAVRKVGSDYGQRPYGAAQIQILLDETVAPEDHQWVLEEMCRIAMPTVRAVVGAHAQSGQGEGK